MKEQITYDIFDKVDIRIGTVLSVKKNIKARKPSLVIEVDFGKEIGIKQSSAQITHFYNEENLKEKAKLDTLERKNAEQAIQYFEHHGVLDSRNFKMLEPLCREEISISNRELYSFTVQVKPEWRKYLKKQTNERKGSTTHKN